ncbi:uncharacterized protein LOC120210412 [Hibiscus syriacus]|uniref:uncharacterized protein LOC120210412 n=1 Tax=Hibiscus syriacus TaxID=106335 RepID=UPI001923B7B8|nr:uncharacterized protein LOC120210412 [Hibiscus syriacus]
MKQLKQNATESSQGFLVPMDDDEVRVDACDDEANGTYCFKAEISTLGSRLRIHFGFIGCRIVHADGSEAREYIARSIRQAMDSVKEKASISPEYLPAFPK